MNKYPKITWLDKLKMYFNIKKKIKEIKKTRGPIFQEKINGA